MIRVLFVCLGNICRSPMAEFIMKDIVNKKGISNKFIIDSAGTSDEEHGNPIYPPAREKLDKEGIPYSARGARKINSSDYDKYDYILCMDRINELNIKEVFNDKYHKVFRLLDFSKNPRDISDPWYTRNFNVCYDELCEGINSFLEYLGF